MKGENNQQICGIERKKNTGKLKAAAKSCVKKEVATVITIKEKPPVHATIHRPKEMVLHWTIRKAALRAIFPSAWLQFVKEESLKLEPSLFLEAEKPLREAASTEAPRGEPCLEPPEEAGSVSSVALL